MNGCNFAGVSAAALSIIITITATLACSQAKGPARPGWFLQGSAPDPGGRLVVGPGGRIIGADGGAIAARPAGAVPACSHSPLCGNPLGGARSALQRVEWE